MGGDCLADVGVLRSEPGVYGRIASDPTVSRTITALAADLPAVLAAVDSARAQARRRVWQLAGEHAPDHGVDTSRPVVIDVDATLVTADEQSEGRGRQGRSWFGPPGSSLLYSTLLRLYPASFRAEDERRQRSYQARAFGQTTQRQHALSRHLARSLDAGRMLL